MSRIVRCGLTQTHHDVDGNEPVEKHKKSAIKKHLKLIDEAAGRLFETEVLPPIKELESDVEAAAFAKLWVALAGKTEEKVEAVA